MPSARPPKFARLPFDERYAVMTLDQIGAAMGISHQRVQQLLDKALWKLRKGLAAKGMDEGQARQMLGELEQDRIRRADSLWERLENG